MRTIFTLLFLSFLSTALAQTTFEFETFTADYQDLQESISLNDGEIWDDPQYVIPLGFSFTLSEETFDTIYIVEDGTGGALSSNESFIGQSFNLFLPVVQDIIDRGDFTGAMSLSNISYLTEGEVGNQITKIEYNNVGFFEDDSLNDFINFQVWFYEGNNVLEYRYGESSILNPQDSYEGLQGLSVGLLPSLNEDTDLFEDGYFLTNDPVNPDIVIIEAGQDIDQVPSLVGDIPANTVYRLTQNILGLESKSKFEISLYPNPIKDELHISYSGDINSIVITDASGRELLDLKTPHRIINMSTFTAGVYHIKIFTEEGEIVKSLIKK